MFLKAPVQSSLANYIKIEICFNKKTKKNSIRYFISLFYRLQVFYLLK